MVLVLNRMAQLADQNRLISNIAPKKVNVELKNLVRSILVLPLSF